MQYKIPVQIENEDPIFLGLGLKQLMIIMIGGGIAFTLFDNLQTSMPKELAAVPAVIIFLITVLVAVFKHSEMTFIPFFLNLLRSMLNPSQRKWDKGVDGFQPMDIGYISSIDGKKEDTIDFESKKEKLQNLEDNINKL
ncbi:PrgI family protein [Candidatus Gracilibacteria bacterium]|nr:PrgI family protein [Candidatus Gracilibacteria bacterium]